MAASKFKYVLGRAWSDDIDNSTVVFFLTETFKNQVVSNRLLVLDQVIGPARRLDHQGVSIFADLTLKRFPEEG